MMEKIAAALITIIVSCAATAAQPLQFTVELTATGHVEDQIAEVTVDLPAVRDVLGHDLTAGGWSARVVSATIGEAALAQTFFEQDAEGSTIRARVAWLVGGEFEAGATRAYVVTLGGEAEHADAAAVAVERTDDEIIVRTPQFTAHHDLHAGGLLGTVEFAGGGVLPMRMNDRLWSEGRGGWNLTNDREPQVEILARGPLMAVVRTTARYCNADGQPAPGEPQATYDFAYCASAPTVRMQATVSQHSGPDWDQVHVFEMYHRTEQPFFDTVAWSPPLTGIPFVDEAKTHSLRSSHWGALLTDQVALALIGPDLYGIHTGLSGHGVYVHGPWHTFRNGTRSFDATLYLGPSGGSAEALASILANLSVSWRARVRMPQLENAVAQVRADIAAAAAAIDQRLEGERRERARWLLEVARCLAADAERGASSLEGLRDWEAAVAAAAEAVSTVSAQWTVARPPALTPAIRLTEDSCVLAGGATVLRLTRDGTAVRVAQIARAGEQPALMIPPGTHAGDLWSLDFRRGIVGEMATLTPADADSAEWSIAEDGEGVALTIMWEGCDLGGVADAVDVAMTVRVRRASDLTRWSLSWNNRTDEWGIWEITCPRIRGIGPGGQVCAPTKWGTVYEVPLAGSGYRSSYPRQGAFAQMMCWWRDGAGGVYYAAHDPEAGVKNLAATNSGGDTVGFEFGTWPAGMGVPAAQGKLGFDVVIGAFDGDWFDAAKIYREWALDQFWCRKGPIAEREDMASWWKNCALCFRPTGDAEAVRAMGTALQAAFGMDAVLHWYKWHQIPFDNDYPEYFPVVPGFGDTVAALQDVGVHVMPYVNGHLWDTDTASWEAENARSGAALTPEGDLYIEGWQGQKHAAMCPHSQLWADKLNQIALRLASEYGCDGIYLDQIGAARVRLCFARDHGHPVGGGGFWTRGYDDLLARMRANCRAVNPRFIITTESQAEPYMAGLDGCLMCNLVGANQVPLFSAIYGGYTQTFGRQGEVGNPAAFRMEHGQAFAFGSMMGRINSTALLEPDKAELLAYLKSLAEIRRDYRDYLAFGEMLRPPALEGVPDVTAQWSSKTRDIVSMCAIQASGWRAMDGSVGFFYTNVSDRDVPFTHEIDLGQLGLLPGDGDVDVDVTMRTFDGSEEREPILETPEGGPLTVRHTLHSMETMVVIVAAK